MRKKRLISFFTAALLTAAFSYGIAATISWLSSRMVRSPLEGLENQIVDLAFQIRKNNPEFSRFALDDVVVIDIDDASIEKLGRPQLWPRACDAYAISYVASGSPKAIGIDYLYTELDTLSPVYAEILEARGFEDTRNIVRALSTDPELAMALADAGNVYLAMFDDDSRQSDSLPCPVWPGLRYMKVPARDAAGFKELTYPVLPVQDFLERSRAAGMIDVTPMSDGTVRHYQLLHKIPEDGDSALLLANFPLYMALDAMGVDQSAARLANGSLYFGDSLGIPLREDGSFRINWTGSEDELRYISFYKIMNGRTPAEYYEGKFVFFGTSAAGLQDMKTVPSGNELMPGVEVPLLPSSIS